MLTVGRHFFIQRSSRHATKNIQVPTPTSDMHATVIINYVYIILSTILYNDCNDNIILCGRVVILSCIKKINNNEQLYSRQKQRYLHHCSTYIL